MPVASILSEITHAITDVIGHYGLYAVFLLMLIDAVLPAASEVVMVYGGAVAAGAFAGQSATLFGHAFEPGFSAYVAMALAGTIGYLIGAILGWWIGMVGGRPFLERHGRWLHLDSAKLDKAEGWFDRWGERAVFIGRVTPVARSFISVPAGVFEAPLRRYTLLTAVGSAAWCFAFAGAGWAAGANWEHFHDRFKFIDYAFAAVVVGGVLAVGLRMYRKRRPAEEAV